MSFNIKQGINLPGFLYYDQLVFVIFTINFWIMKKLRSLDNLSRMIKSYSMKIKDVIVSLINFLEKQANNNLLVIHNICKLKLLLIIFVPCSSPVTVLRLQLILILENQWSQNLLALPWSVNLK